MYSVLQGNRSTIISETRDDTLARSLRTDGDLWRHTALLGAVRTRVGAAR